MSKVKADTTKQSPKDSAKAENSENESIGVSIGKAKKTNKDRVEWIVNEFLFLG